MSPSLWKLTNPILSNNITSTLVNAIRNGHHIRGKPPGVAKSLEQKLSEVRHKDPSLHFRVDIGLPPSKISKKIGLQERLQVKKGYRHDAALESLARNRQLVIDLEDHNREWLITTAPEQIKVIADHYGVFEHLYGDAYFCPRVPINIYYEVEDGNIPVYYGNVLKPADTKKKPTLIFDSDKDTFWTLVLTNPDGHFRKSDREYIHWFVGNIQGNDVNNGETVVEYLQPFPPKGTGYHRHIFILYKQEKKLDFSSLTKDNSCLTLLDRTFSTYDFYRERQDDLTPSGLAFFQADWDTSLKDFYHDVFDIKEPIYEYDFPLPYVRPQEWFPKRRPFNIYMDKYRDPKQINKEYLMKKLKNIHPFNGPPKSLPYSNAERFEGYIPSWLKTEIAKTRLKWGRVNEID